MFKAICQSWIKSFRHAPAAALLKFMQFVLEASGSQYQIPSVPALPFNYSEILIAATAHFGNVRALLTKHNLTLASYINIFIHFQKRLTYPLIIRTGKSFARNICQFVQCLMGRCLSSGLLLEDVFLNDIFGFLLVCVDSKVRAFRHTCTFIGK